MTSQPHVPHEPHVPVRTYWIVFISLMVLLGLTVAAAELERGPFSIALAVAIAIVKAVLILLFFMHVKYSSRLIWLFAGASFLWFIIMVVGIMDDFLTRPLYDVIGK